jgi:hypothetical protein
MALPPATLSALEAHVWAPERAALHARLAEGERLIHFFQQREGAFRDREAALRAELAAERLKLERATALLHGGSAGSSSSSSSSLRSSGSGLSLSSLRPQSAAQQQRSGSGSGSSSPRLAREAAARVGRAEAHAEAAERGRLQAVEHLRQVAAEALQLSSAVAVLSARLQSAGLSAELASTEAEQQQQQLAEAESLAEHMLGAHSGAGAAPLSSRKALGGAAAAAARTPHSAKKSSAEAAAAAAAAFPQPYTPRGRSSTERSVGGGGGGGGGGSFLGSAVV